MLYILFIIQDEAHIQHFIYLYGNYVSLLKDIEVNFPEICKTILFSEPSWINVVVHDQFNKWHKALYDKIVLTLVSQKLVKYVVCLFLVILLVLSNFFTSNLLLKFLFVPYFISPAFPRYLFHFSRDPFLTRFFQIV